MDRQRLGLILLAIAPAAWLIAVLAEGFKGFTVALLLMLAGWAAVAWAVPASNRIMAAIGFVVAAAGVGLFYRFSFFEGLPTYAGLVVAIGSIVAAVGTGTQKAMPLALGLGIVGLGALMWVIADGLDGLEWQAGNLLALIGSALAAMAMMPRGPAPAA